MRVDDRSVNHPSHRHWRFAYKVVIDERAPVDHSHRFAPTVQLEAHTTMTTHCVSESR